MALSNIFREPRRELTESAVGIVVSVVSVASYVALVWAIAQAFGPLKSGDMIPAYLLAVIITLGGGLIIAAFVNITHAIGDSICNVLQQRGVHLRPRQRY